MNGGTCCRFEPRDAFCPVSNPVDHSQNLQVLGNILIGPVYVRVYYAYHFFKHIDELGVPCDFNMKSVGEILYANIVTYLPDAKIKIQVKSDTALNTARRPASTLRASPSRASPSRASPSRASPSRVSPSRVSLRASTLRASPSRASTLRDPVFKFPAQPASALSLKEELPSRKQRVSPKNSKKAASPTKFLKKGVPLLPFETTLWAHDYLLRKLVGQKVLADRAGLLPGQLKTLQYENSNKSFFRDVIDLLPNGDYIAYIEVSKKVVYRVMFEYKETHLSNKIKTAKITLVHLERKRDKTDDSFYAHRANYDGQ